MAPSILATGKNVMVIGGGDTGTDCVSTSMRQGCNSMVQYSRFCPRPPEGRAADEPMARVAQGARP